MFFRRRTNNLRQIRRIIVGLGNPGGEYSGTRHNLGFMALDEILRVMSVRKQFRAKGRARIQEIEIDGKKVLLVRPSTYMNLSGNALKPLLVQTGLEITDVLVIHDEMDLPVGRAKMRSGGGAAGHNGVSHIMETCGADFARIKIGIGNDCGDYESGADYVLSKPDRDEMEIYRNLLPKVVHAVELWVSDGMERSMTWFNTETKSPKPARKKESKTEEPTVNDHEAGDSE